MVIVKRWIVFIVILLVLFSSNAFRVKGTSRYVNASTGVNSGDCSNMSSPCKTITYAISQSSSGDGISIAAGTYDSALGETFPLTINNISLSLWGANYTTTIIDASGSGQNVINVTGDASNQVNIQNLTIKNGLIGISLIGLGGASGRLIADVKSNKITGNSQHGIYARLTQAIIDRNAIAWNGTGSAYAGIYNYDTRNYVTNNAIGWNDASGIWNEYVDSLNYIVNNSISFNYSGSGVVANNSSYPEITNNIITSNGVYGIVAMNSSTPPASYNDVWANAWANYYGVSAGTGSISTDPLYTSWFDAHLLCNSPAINRGNNSANGIPSYDGDGNTRIVGGTVDMGAYERQSELFCHLYIPYVVDTAAQRTNLAVGNTGTATANITVYFYNTDGTLNASRTNTVPQYQYTQMNSVIRWVRNLGETSPTGLEGYIKVEPDQPVYVVGSQNDNTSNDPSATLGKRTTQAYLNAIIPVILNIGTSWNSFVVIDNMGSSSANVTLTFYNYDGVQTGSPYTITGLATGGQWSSADIGATLGLSDGVYGMLKISSTQSVLASVRGYTAQNTGAFLEGISSSSGAVDLIVPYVVDTTAQRTNLAVGNMGTGSASVTITFYNQDGTVNATRSDTVSQDAYKQFNSVIRWVRNLGETSPTGLQGYIRVTSDKNIYAVGSQNDNTSNDPSATLGKNVFETYYNGAIPVVLNIGTSWNSFIAIDNRGTSSADVILKFYPYYGGIVTNFIVMGIAAGGQWSSNDIGATMGLSDGDYGMLLLYSTQPILASVRGYTAQNTGAFLEGISIV